MSDSKELLIQRYPYAVRILAAASQVDLELERVPHPLLDGNELALVRMAADGKSHVVLVDNEYGDADSGHRALLLAQVLMALDAYREDPSFASWCRDQFLELPPEELKPFHDALGPAAAAFEERFQELSPPDDYSWSLNSDGSQALRRIAGGEF